MTRQTESGLIQVLRDLKMTLGTKFSAHLPHPCINTDGQVLAPIRAPMPATLALHKDAPEHVSSAATHNQTNNLSVDAGPNSLALFQKMPTPSSPAVVVRAAAPARYPSNPGMPAGPYESPSTRTREKQIQGTKERSTVIAFLGKWKRGFAIKTVISTTVITNKDRTHKYTTFKKWKLYTRLGITTTNLNAHTVRTSLTEALCKWRRLLSAKNVRHITKKLACALTARLETQEKNTSFNEWWLHTTDISVFHHLHVQLLLKGLASEIHTITGPYLVQESYVVSRIHYLLEHSTARQTPCLPSCKGTASHVRYECTQFIIRYHLYCSTAARPAHRLTTPFSNLSNPSNFSKWCSYGFLEYTEILVLTKTTIQF
jgi:hypothetical protein